MLEFLSPHEYSLIHLCFHKSDWQFAAVIEFSKEPKRIIFSLVLHSYKLLQELGHQLLQDTSYFQLSLANTDA